MLPVLLNPPDPAKAGVAEVASKPMAAMDKITSVLANCEFLRIMEISFFTSRRGGRSPFEAELRIAEDWFCFQQAMALVLHRNNCHPYPRQIK
jgi:hypothetical protein